MAHTDDDLPEGWSPGEMLATDVYFWSPAPDVPPVPIPHAPTGVVEEDCLCAYCDWLEVDDPNEPEPGEDEGGEEAPAIPKPPPLPQPPPVPASELPTDKHHRAPPSQDSDSDIDALVAQLRPYATAETDAQAKVLREAYAYEQRRAVARDVYFTFHTDTASWFTASLLRLMNRADPTHQYRLGIGFPTVWAVYQEWMRTSPEKDFFHRYKLEEIINPPDLQRYLNTFGAAGSDD